MGLVLLTHGDDFALLADGWRIPRAKARRLGEAGALLAAAGDWAKAAETMAVEAEAEARRCGYETGLAEGRAAGAAEAARAVASLAQEVRQSLQELRASLGSLSLDVVRRIAAELGPEAMLEAIVEQAAREVLADQPLTIHVPPPAAPGVARRLWPLNAAIEVVADAKLDSSDCIIVTPHGSIRAGLELELAALERAFAELESPGP